MDALVRPWREAPDHMSQEQGAAETGLANVGPGKPTGIEEMRPALITICQYT